jgi:hypothetical protein
MLEKQGFPIKQELKIENLTLYFLSKKNNKKCKKNLINNQK